MPLWSMVDANTGAPKNNLIIAASGSTANGFQAYQNTQVGGYIANLAVGVFGIDAREKGNAQHEGPIATHAGWVLRKQGTGPVQSIAVSNGGKGFTGNATAKYLTITGGGTSNNSANASFTVRANGSIDNVVVSPAGAGYANGFLTVTSGGTGNNQLANISYTVNGTGAIVSTTIVNGGADFDTVPTVQALGANSAKATVVVTTNTGTITSVTVSVGGSNYVNTPSVITQTTTNNATPTFVVTMGGRAGRVHYECLVAASSMATDNVANSDDTIVGA